MTQISICQNCNIELNINIIHELCDKAKNNYIVESMCPRTELEHKWISKIIPDNYGMPTK